jgi:ABC-type lipoprotein export system ATPase subunit
MFARRSRRNGSGNGSANGNGVCGNGESHLIEVRQLVKTYETSAGPFPALKNVDLEINCGEFVAVIGKSGSGKSTLVNMITGIDRPTSGQVLVGDTAVHTLGEGKLAQWRGRNVGVIFQFFQLLPTLTVIENVMLPMDFCHMYTPRERKERAMWLLEQMELADHAYKLPSAVSGGQQQRAAIARALANDPPILVADEPTGNLDSKTAESVFRLFEQQVDRGKTILMVTHDRDLAKRATRTIMLADGEVIEEYLTRTFPALSEQQLVWASRNLDREDFAPGALILREGAPADKFYIIMKGEIEVIVDTVDGDRMVVSRMGRGQYFGEVELLRGGTNIATIRAAPERGVQVVTMDRTTFESLVADSEPTRLALAEVAQARMAENIDGRQRDDVKAAMVSSQATSNRPEAGHD